MGGTTAGDIGVVPTAFVVISRPVPWTKKRDVRKKIRAALHSSGYFEDDGPADVRIFVRWRSDPKDDFRALTDMPGPRWQVTLDPRGADIAGREAPAVFTEAVDQQGKEEAEGHRSVDEAMDNLRQFLNGLPA